MTIEETNLLFQDICGRLRSGLICSIYREDDEGFGWRDAECKGYFQNNDSYEFYFDDVITVDNIERLKPYLRPMSSMTEEEKEELRQEHIKDEKLFAECLKKAANGDSSMRCKVVPHFAADWCDKNHFDYRGLIPMELAIEAPEGMYKKD